MNDGSTDTPAASKRQKSDSQQTKSSSNSKKTRSNNMQQPLDLRGRGTLINQYGLRFMMDLGVGDGNLVSSEM